VIIAAVVVAVLAAGGIVAVLIAGGSNKNSSSSTDASGLSLPTTVGSYDELSGGTADQFRTTMGQAFGTSGQLGNFFAKADIGLYGTNGQPPPKYILVAAPADQYPALRASSLNGSGGIRSYPAGSHGGAVDCFPQSVGTVQESVCFWSDSQTVGYLVSINATETTAQVAALVNTARDTIDH
jgi:hypothetical protein